MLKIKNGIIGINLIILLGMLGCSTGPKVQEFPATANATEEIQKLGVDMQAATAAQADVLSPSAYKNAKEALDSAITAQKKGNDAKDVLHDVAVGRAHLNRANQFAGLARTNMEEVAAARTAAVKADAPRLFPDDFKDADKNLRNLTSEIEDNDLGGVAKNRAKLQAAYLEVELKAIKKANLGAAIDTIAVAKKEGAKDYAKQSLAIAEKSVTDAEAFIIANRHQTDAIKSRSDNAMVAANHALKITRASKAGENVSPEEVALRIENEQRRTQSTEAQLAAEKEATSKLSVQTGQLKSEQEFNRSFEEARNEFTAGEAEVYRKGNELVIRLKALEFPVNQSVLRGSNFPLLAKVAKVVEKFENPTVVIEGHTDSDGGQALNKKLSIARADAIRDYLVSNEAVDEENITASGYGFEKPLASNKTAKGKAQNRRVDVVISPQMAAR